MKYKLIDKETGYPCFARKLELFGRVVRMVEMPEFDEAGGYIPDPREPVFETEAEAQAAIDSLSAALWDAPYQRSSMYAWNLNRFAIVAVPEGQGG